MHLPKGTATLALPVSFPVETMDDWRRLKHHYTFAPERIEEPLLPLACKARAEGCVIVAPMPGGFDEPRQLLGEENLCLAYYEDPELIHDILATLSETAFKVIERATRETPLDLLFVHEDMAGRSGPLIGPSQVREFITPYYRRIWDLAQDRGARLFDQDSDGDMRPVIPAFLEAGVNLMHPMEPAAGMDVADIRDTYGEQLAFYGGLDKFALVKGKEAIDAELAHKLPLLMKTGGCMPGLDHRIPAEVTLENYRYYIQRVWEYLDANS